jgi:subtilase family serine protease
MRRSAKLAALALVTTAALAGPSLPAASAAPKVDLPDLLVVSIGYAYNSDCSLISSINSVFQNNGTADAGPFGVRFLIDGHRVRTFLFAGLAAGMSTHTRPFSVSPPLPFTGDHTLTVILDIGNHVVESDETNNTLSSDFTCA